MTDFVVPFMRDMTPEKLQEAQRPIGVGLPFPIARPKAGSETLEMEMGVVDPQNPLMIYSTHMSQEELMHMVYCYMPTWSMMSAAHKLYEMSSPAIKNRIFTLIGDASTGKTMIFRQYGQMVHPEGAIVVDCSGMDLGELIWRPMLDPGKGVREQLNERAAAGRINPETVALFKEEFPGSIIEKNGIVAIDWSAVGVRRTGEDSKATESFQEAADRAKKMLTHVLDVLEGLDGLSNNVGIKMVRGVVYESFVSGRPVLFDEFSKAKPGTAGKLHTFLQLARQDDQEWTSYNPMQSNVDEDEKVMTLRTKDMRMGWGILISGNEAKDGSSTHDLEDSTGTRINTHYIGPMTELDWEHRIPQLIAKFPTTTFTMICRDFAESNPDKMAEIMKAITVMGQNADQIKMALPHRDYFIQNFPDLNQGSRMLAKLCMLLNDLSNPDSELYEAREWQDCADEVMSENGKKLMVSSRELLDMIEDALRPRAGMMELGTSVVDGDMARVFESISRATSAGASSGWHNFGKNLSQEIVGRIYNRTQSMPAVRARLAVKLLEIGITQEELKEAKPSAKKKQSLAELLRFDPLKQKGFSFDASYVEQVMGILQSTLKAIHPDIQLDAKTLPLENIAEALQSVEKIAQGKADAIILPNTDIHTLVKAPIIGGYASPSYAKKSEDTLEMTANLQDVLAALAMPGHATQNLGRLWLSNLQSRVGNTSKLSPEHIEYLKMLDGQSSYGMHIGAVRVRQNEGAESYLFVVNDATRARTLVLGDADISPDLATSLQKNGVAYRNNKSKGAAAAIDAFLGDSLDARDNTASASAIRQTIAGAFATLYGLDTYKFGDGGNLGEWVLQNSQQPKIYTSVFKAKM